MHELTSLVNIGKVVAIQLIQADIHNFEQLKELGSKQAWLRIQDFDPSACYNRLCGLEGAIQGIRWHDLDGQTKLDLKEFYNSSKLTKK